MKQTQVFVVHQNHAKKKKKKKMTKAKLILLAFKDLIEDKGEYNQDYKNAEEALADLLEE